MMNTNDLASAWEIVIHEYEKTIEQNNPEITVKNIVQILGVNRTKEIFATIAAIKKHDGRISGRNRKIFENISVNPEALIWNWENPLLRVDLDRIHTARIDNMITELRKIDENR